MSYGKWFVGQEDQQRQEKNNGNADLYQQVITITGANGNKIDVRFNFAIDNGKTDAHLVGALPTEKN